MVSSSTISVLVTLLPLSSLDISFLTFSLGQSVFYHVISFFVGFPKVFVDLQHAFSGVFVDNLISNENKKLFRQKPSKII